MASLGRRLKRGLSAGSAGEAGTAGGRRIAGQMMLGLASRVVGIAGGIVTLPLLTRMLGPDEFGTWSAGLAYVSLFTALTEFGLTNAATLRMADDPEHEAEWLRALSSLRTVMSLGLLALSLALIPLVLDRGRLGTVAAILAVGILAGGASALTAVFTSRLRGAVPLLLAMAQATLWLGCVALLAVVKVGVITVAIVYIGVQVVVAVLNVLAARHAVGREALRGGADREKWRGLLQIALPIGLGGIFVTIYYKLDAILLHELASPHEAGEYGAAYRFLDPLVIVPSTVMAAFFPVLSAVWKTDPDRVRRLVDRCAVLLGVVALPPLIVSLCLSDQLVGDLFGADFDRSAQVLPLLMGAFVAICYGNLAGFLAPILRLQWRITIYAAIGAVINVALNVILIPDYGAVGSAWATLVTEVLTMLLLMATCLKRLGLKLSPLTLLRVVVAGEVMFVVLLLAKPLGLLPALALGSIAYVIALPLVGAITPNDLKTLRADR